MILSVCSCCLRECNLFLYSSFSQPQSISVGIRDPMFIRPSATVPLSQDVLLKLFNRLQTKEKTVFHNTVIPVDRFDILFLMQQVFKQKSVFSGVSIAGSKLVEIRRIGDI